MHMTAPDGQSRPRTKPGFRLLTIAQIVLAISLLTAAMLPLAMPAISPAATPAEADFVSEESEEEEEGEEAESEEEEAGEEDEEEFVEGAVVYLPSECLLRTAKPSVEAQLAHKSLRLTIGYTADTPTRIGIDYWLKGGKGSLQLGSTTRHIGKQGTIRETARLDDHEVEKVRAARAFVVHLDVPAAASRCNSYLTLRLTAKRLRGNRGTWSEPA
jgi:hypothetical protein